MQKPKDAFPCFDNQLANRQPKLDREHKRHTIRNTIAALSITTTGILAYQNKELLGLGLGFFNKGEMSVPDVEGCDESDLNLPPLPVPPANPGNNQPQNGKPPTAPAPYKAASSARKAGLSDLNLLAMSEQYSQLFNHEIGEYTSPQSGIIFKFYEFGDRHGLSSLDFKAFSEAYHASLTLPITFDRQDANVALGCIRKVILEDKIAAGRVMPVVIPNRPACIRGGMIVYEDCDSKGYTWPDVPVSALAWDLSHYDEFTVITSGLPIEKNTPEREYRIIAHEGAHKWREIAEGSNYEFNLDPEEGWAKYVENGIRSKIASDVDWIYTY